MQPITKSLDFIDTLTNAVSIDWCFMHISLNLQAMYRLLIYIDTPPPRVMKNIIVLNIIKLLCFRRQPSFRHAYKIKQSIRYIELQ